MENYLKYVEGFLINNRKAIMEWIRSLPPNELKEIKELLIELHNLKETNPKLFIQVIQDINQWSKTFRTVKFH
jgi:hypothetical protein